jgi:hypothetical protein
MNTVRPIRSSMWTRGTAIETPELIPTVSGGGTEQAYRVPGHTIQVHTEPTESVQITVVNFSDIPRPFAGFPSLSSPFPRRVSLQREAKPAGARSQSHAIPVGHTHHPRLADCRVMPPPRLVAGRVDRDADRGSH